jgi:hypothetical protein
MSIRDLASLSVELRRRAAEGLAPLGDLGSIRKYQSRISRAAEKALRVPASNGVGFADIREHVGALSQAAAEMIAWRIDREGLWQELSDGVPYAEGLMAFRHSPRTHELEKRYDAIAMRMGEAERQLLVLADRLEPSTVGPDQSSQAPPDGYLPMKTFMIGDRFKTYAAVNKAIGLHSVRTWKSSPGSQRKWVNAADWTANVLNSPAVDEPLEVNARMVDEVQSRVMLERKKKEDLVRESEVRWRQK